MVSFNCNNEFSCKRCFEKYLCFIAHIIFLFVKLHLHFAFVINLKRRVFGRAKTVSIETLSRPRFRSFAMHTHLIFARNGWSVRNISLSVHKIQRARIHDFRLFFRRIFHRIIRIFFDNRLIIKSYNFNSSFC